MIEHILTKTGFECDIDSQKINDMELFDDIVALDAGDALKLPRVMDKLLGSEDKARLYDHVRTEDGRVPIDDVSNEFADIFSQLKHVKN